MDELSQQLRRCQYVILPARPDFRFQNGPLCNEAYDFWKLYWQRTFKTKAPDFWDPLDYFRQDRVYCLYYDGVLAAQNLSTFVRFDQNVTFDLPYFEAFRGSAAELMQAEQVKRIMTLEYTAVHTSFGERRTGIRFAEVMNGLALNVFKELDFDATTGTPRRLSGLSDVTANYGYRKLAEGFKKAGWELDVFLGFKGELNEHPDPIYRDLIRRLWDARIDYTSARPVSLDHVSPTPFTGARVAGASFKNELKEPFMKPQNIRALYAESMAGLSQKFDSFDWTDKDTYSLWLAQAYYLVRHTTRLLALCAGYCPFEYENTHKRILEHLREESGHDMIAVADLKALGIELSDVPELPKTAELIRLQYQQMANISGCAFFGYILLLEGLAVTKAMSLHETVAAKYGPRVTRFLKTHAEDDIEHIEQAFQQIEAFSPEDQLIVADNLRDSSRLYGMMLDSVRETLARRKVGEAAISVGTIVTDLSLS